MPDVTVTDHEGLILDPFGTIQNINWEDDGYSIFAIRFVGSGAATGSGSPGVLPANAPVAFGRYDIYPTGGGSLYDLPSLGDNASEFFEAHPYYETEDLGAGVAMHVSGQTFWYFAAVPDDRFTLEILLDTAACFPSGEGSLQAHARFFRAPPANTVIPNPELPDEGYFRFSDLVSGTPTAYDDPGGTTLDVNRWQLLTVTVQNEDGPLTPTWDWDI